MKGHIDKLSKNIEFDIKDKPIGAIQWDFICSIPEAEQSMIQNYEDGPESIFLYLTSKCSMKCKDCNNNIQELDIENIRKLIDEQSKKRLNYVILDGDPFKYHDIQKIIEIFENYKMTYSINTFSMPTDKALNYIANTVSKIQFKMKNINSEDEYTKRVINTLKKCKEKGIYTAIIFSIIGDNHTEIKEMIDFCKKYNVRQFSFSRLDICYKKKNHNFIDKDNYLKLSETLLSFRKTENKIHITSNDAIWKGCGACSTSLTIMPNGDIIPCAYLNIVCGNLKKQEIEKAWASEVFKNIRESNLKGKCGECKYKFLCKGCRALPYIKGNDYLEEDKGCWI
ncbi:MAG: SPASM domain-containing protein [Clostridia bacterium]|nr:SPASM domain-containing protein [Clostridia bacterium]